MHMYVTKYKERIFLNLYIKQNGSKIVSHNELSLAQFYIDLILKLTLKMLQK